MRQCGHSREQSLLVHTTNSPECPQHQGTLPARAESWAVMLLHGNAAWVFSTKPACTSAAGILWPSELSTMLPVETQGCQWDLGIRGHLVHKEGRALFIESLTSLPLLPGTLRGLLGKC